MFFSPMYYYLCSWGYVYYICSCMVEILWNAVLLVNSSQLYVQWDHFDCLKSTAMERFPDNREYYKSGFYSPQYRANC